MHNTDQLLFKDQVITEAFATTFTAPVRTPAQGTRVLQMRATTGLGKTRTLIDEIANDPALRGAEIHYYVPDYELAREIEALARSAGFPRVFVMAGRSGSEVSRGYCQRFPVADAVAKAGLNVYRTCCQKRVSDGDIRCTHFEDCPYLMQWADPEPAFRIMVHNYVFLPKPKRDGIGLPEPVLAVVDESVVAKAWQEHSFGVDRLPEPYDRAVRMHLRDSTDLRGAMLSCSITDLNAWRAAKDLESDMTAGLYPGLARGVALEKLAEIIEGERRGIIAFLRAVAYELELGRSFHGIEVRKDEKVKIDGRWEKQDRVHVFERLECHVSRHASLLILDADANLQLNEQIFGAGIEAIEILAQQRAHVVQVHSTSLSKHTLTKDEEGSEGQPNTSLRKVEKIVSDEMQRATNVLVVMPKEVEKHLAELRHLSMHNEIPYWQGAEVAHFGAIRGQDRWKSFNTLIVISRNEPPPKAVECMARALFCDDPEPLRLLPSGQQFPKKVRGYRLSNGQLLGVKTSLHPDPRIQAILEQIRECETLQAIGRLRLVFAAEPKRIVILSSVPLDIDVDELVSLDELAGTEGREGPQGRLRKAMDATGVVPLGAGDLAVAHRDIFSKESAARDALRGAKNGGELQIEDLFGMHPHFIEVTYRRDGQRGKPSRAVVDANRHPDPVTAITAAVGAPVRIIGTRPPGTPATPPHDHPTPPAAAPIKKDTPS